MTKNGRTVSLYVDAAQLKNSMHASMACADCHRGLNPMEFPHAKVIRPVQCRNCHEIEGFVHGSAAAKTPGPGCADCHGSHAIRSVKDPNSGVSRTRVSGTCGKCHGEAFRQFAASAHRGVLASKGSRSPNCVECHGTHKVLSAGNSESPVSKQKEPALCLKCHLDDPGIRNQVGYSAGFIAGYEKSVHGTALRAGNLKSAVCSDCHGSHDLKRASDAGSWVGRSRIVTTCSRCHAQIAEVFNDSIHGMALQKGNMDAPTCTRCHGEHEIFARKDPRSPVAPANISVQVCATCHNSVPLSRKYGFPAGQFDSFQDSFHGLAAKAGSVEVANCASCHGIHNIKPSSDPKSTVNKANLPTTCGTCHPGAGKNFAKGAVHVVIGPESGPAILYWIRAVYLFLIGTVISGMFLHNFLDFIHRTRRRFAVRQGKIALEHLNDEPHIRMTLNDRIQHAALFTSFIVLAATGFMLRYPDAWWVIPIRQMSEGFFQVRSTLHRVAAIVLIGISVYHILCLLFTRHGRQFARDIFPRWNDFSGFWANLRYLMGLSRKRPLFDRFGYVEKTEYWALVWGVLIMSMTGIVMWFDNYFMESLTKLGWDISRTIHFYEAVLASLAILVWHFYFVILNPDVYPMSTTWLTGKISSQELAEDHPLEYERLNPKSLDESP